MDWPDDADGDVFRQLHECGFDFAQEVDIEFNIDFDHWPLSAQEKASIAMRYPGCQIIEPDEEDLENGDLIGYVQLRVRDKLSYDLVTTVQRRVTSEMASCGGWCDSWGVMHG